MQRSGVTLAELLVVLAIMGLTAVVAGLAFTSLRSPTQTRMFVELRQARAEAIRTGKPIALESPPATMPSGRVTVRFLPDGRALGPGVDPLTGTPISATA